MGYLNSCNYFNLMLFFYTCSPEINNTFYSGSGAGSLVEPLSAVPLNDELQQARQSVLKAEAEVLLKITKKV